MYRGFIFMILAGVAAMSSGCQLLSTTTQSRGEKPDSEAQALPQKFSQRVSQFNFQSDFKLPDDQPMFRELTGLREQVFKELKLPTSNTLVHVYLFENRELYEKFLLHKYPQLPPRRAFFIAQARWMGGTEDLFVYTYWGDKVQQDLRHELTHALLHSVIKDVPIWLDEGLAEYFEMPPGWNGVNYLHLSQLRQAAQVGQQADMVRLERLTGVNEMKHREYYESWAWVHFMLQGNPQAKQVLVQYLHDLRANSKPGPLHPRLAAAIPNLEAAFQQHLAALDYNSSAQGAPVASSR